MVPNSKNVLCKNKDKLIPNSYAGVDGLKCSCRSAYDGETKKKIIARSLEYQHASIKCTKLSSVATEYTKECHGRFE